MVESPVTCTASKRKVLIVDSNAEEAEEISRFLPCFQSEIAGSMRDAVLKLNLADSATSCIILDPQLPNGTGVNLVQKFHDIYPTIPVLIIVSEPEQVEKLKRAGVETVLLKPPTGEELRRMLIDVIVKYEMNLRYDPMDSAIQELHENAQNAARTLKSINP